eukprot:1694596-Rhodomonas_salina.2
MPVALISSSHLAVFVGYVRVARSYSEALRGRLRDQLHAAMATFGGFQSSPSMRNAVACMWFGCLYLIPQYCSRPTGTRPSRTLASTSRTWSR